MNLQPRRGAATWLFQGALALGLLLAPNLYASTELRQPDDELSIQEKSRWGEVLVDRDADWRGYDRFILETASVSFRKNWERDQKVRNNNRVTEEDIQRIKSDLAGQLDEIFTLELTRNGSWTRSETVGAGVLRITPEIVDLDIIAPDRMRNHIGYAVADSKGRMTLKLQISDSISNDVLARATEHRQDPRMGYFEWATSAQNRLAARHILKLWGSRLREWLEEQRQPSSSLAGN